MFDSPKWILRFIQKETKINRKEKPPLSELPNRDEYL
jgi:hypothetical protein